MSLRAVVTPLSSVERVALQSHREGLYAESFMRVSMTLITNLSLSFTVV